MVFLKRTTPANPRKRPSPTPEPHSSTNPNPNPTPATTTTTTTTTTTANVSKSNFSDRSDDDDIQTMTSVLAAAGCTLRVSPDALPSLPADLHRLRRTLDSRLSSDPSLLARFLSGLSSYIRRPQNLKRILLPASADRSSESLVRLLLLVPPLQAPLQRALLEKLPEHFDTSPVVSLNDDVARLIVNQFRWLDFLVDAEGFAERLMEVNSISPLHLKKEIIGSLPEIIGDSSHGAVVAALAQMLQEDSEVIVPVLDSFANLNLDDQLQEQAVTVALSCIRTVDAEHMPYLLRFLLLSATAVNVRRIIGQIREQLKFVGPNDPRVARNKKLKGKSVADTTEASILDALRSSLRFKNIICEAILKELKCLDQPREHKVIDVWFVMLIYKNGGSMQKAAEKILKKKIIDGCFREVLFNQCIHGQRELVKDYFPSFLSVCECLLACKEKPARDFGIYLYESLFEEFTDAYSRQELLGALVTHIGSGIGHEVCSALETMTSLTSKYAQELLPISFCINGILDYLEGFHEQNLHKVYEVFCNLALSAHSGANSSTSSSITNELLMIIRKQVSNSDMKYRKMGIIGTMKIISSFGNTSAATSCLPSQKTNCQEALELLKLSLDSCKSEPLPLILLYDELIALLELNTAQPAIIEWIGKHVGDFESLFLSDIEGGKLPMKDPSDDLEGDLWMNLDGDISPICLNILPLHLSSSQQCSSSLQILPCQFLLLSIIERLTNQGSLGGIDALLGCPLHLPSPKYFGSHWTRLTAKQKQTACISLYYGINWIRELLNSFSRQVIGRVDCITQATRNETITKLLKRLRNLVFMESLLNACLKDYPLSLPELQYPVEQPGSPFVSKANHSIQREKKSHERPVSQGTSQTNKRVKKDKVASEKLNPYEKLRQPTILDTFKKAGVISQEVVLGSSPSHSSHGKASQCIDNQDNSNEAGPVDISAEFTMLYAQRSKFRPLLVDCLSMLSFSESHESCCSDPAAELPLHLYLLRDFHNKLDYLNPPSKPFPTASAKASPGNCRMTTCNLFKKIRPLFPSMKKHLDDALNILRDGRETCENHWKYESSYAGNPDIPHLVVSETSAARFVFREVLCCFSKMLSVPDIFLQTNFPILREMLEAFHPNGGVEHFFSGLQPTPTAGNIDYLYCGMYSVLEKILETVYTFSFLLASEVLVTLQSVVNSIVSLTGKYTDANGKNTHVGCFQGILPFLRNRLGLSAHKLLVHNWDGEDTDGWKNKGDTVQKILQIYLKNSDATSDLLDELACSVLPQVPSCKTKNTQELVHGFPMLCPTMFLTWCRVLHEENLLILNKLVKDVILKSRANAQRETVKDVLAKLCQSVNIVVSLVNMCKIHDKVAVHAMAVKYGGKFVDTFLKVFDFLQLHFQSHNEDIIQLVKELQKATRIIQTLCSEAKGSKRTMVTSKIPATKRSMERFLFHVKALLHNTSNGRTFWMGNLKHKDLYGQVVSSQVYVYPEVEEATTEAHIEEVDLEASAEDCGQGDRVSD